MIGNLHRFKPLLREVWAFIFRPGTGQWYESPAHNIIKMMARYCHTRYKKTFLRRVYFHFAAILKYREITNVQKLVFAKAIEGTSLVQTRTELALWQHQLRHETPEISNGLPVHAVFELNAQAQRPFDLLAPIFSSGNFSSLSFCWLDGEPSFDIDGFLPVRDRQPPERDRVLFNSDRQFPMETLVHTDRHGAPQMAAAIQVEALRKVNDLVKLAMPGSLVVAVALKEDELGFCDAELKSWLPLFKEMHKRFPWVRFCILNPTTIGASASHELAEVGALSVRARGLDDLAAFAMPSVADLFIGEHTDFGMVAAQASRPGIYLNPRTGDYHCNEKWQWFMARPSFEDIIPILSKLIEEFTPARAKSRFKADRRDPAASLNGRSKGDAPKRGRQTLIVGRQDNGTGKKGHSVPAVVTESVGWEERVRKSNWFRPAEERPTVTLYIDIFGYCNLRCPSCPVGNWPKDGESAFRAGLMDEALLRQILEKALGEVKVSSVGLFNWTEPLLNPQVNRLIEVVKSYGLFCSISSNLNILRDPEGLLSSGLDWLRISVSGFQQEIYKLNHKGGDIDRVMQNMRRLAEARDAVNAKTDIELFFHKYVDNEQDEKPMREFAESLGFRFVDAWAYLMPVEKMLAVANADGKNVTLTDEDRALIGRLALPPEPSMAIARKHKVRSCNLYDYLTIDVKGDIYLCCASSARPSNRLGSFLELSFDEIRKKQYSHRLCGPCIKQGLPVLYGHGDPEFEELGRETRNIRQNRPIDAKQTVGSRASAQ